MKKPILFALLATSFAALAQKPVEVTVQQVNDRRTNGSFAELSIALQLPKMLSSEVAASRVLVKSATDDTGQSLVETEKQPPELTPNMSAAYRPADAAKEPAQVSVSLKNPSRKARTVREVRGEIELYMPSKDPNSVAEVAKFVSYSGKALAHKALKANGVEISLVGPAQLAAEKKRLADAKRKEYKDSGFEDGEELENIVKGAMEYTLRFEPGDVPVRVKDPNKRIQEIVFLDGAGEVKQASLREGEEGIQVISTWGDAPQPDWKLRVSMKTPKNIVRYAFSLKDVALP